MALVFSISGLRDVDALVDCIMKLYNSPNLYKKMSANARKIFDEIFDLVFSPFFHSWWVRRQCGEKEMMLWMFTFELHKKKEVYELS